MKTVGHLCRINNAVESVVKEDKVGLFLIFIVERAEEGILDHIYGSRMGRINRHCVDEWGFWRYTSGASWPNM